MQAGRDRITTPVGSRGRCRPEGGQQYQTKSANSEIKQTAEEGPGLWVAASEVAEKVSRFVGRAFRHDIKSAFPSGVLTPEGLKASIHSFGGLLRCRTFHRPQCDAAQNYYSRYDGNP